MKHYDVIYKLGKVNEMKMLRWICGVTRKDKIKYEYIREAVGVANISNIVTERLLMWFGNVNPLASRATFLSLTVHRRSDNIVVWP